MSKDQSSSTSSGKSQAKPGRLALILIDTIHDRITRLWGHAPRIVRHHPLFSLCMLATFLRLLGMAAAFNPEMWEFDEIASALLSGRGYSYHFLRPEWHPSAYMPPAYPVIIAAAFTVFGKGMTAYVALGLLNVAAGALGTIPILRLGEALYGRTAGWLAAALWALFPASVFMAARLHPIALYTPLSVWTVLMALTWFRADSRRLALRCAAAFGLLAGLMILFRAEYPLIVMLIVFWVLVAGRKQALRVRILASVIALTAVLVVSGGWTLRNYMVFNRLIPVAGSNGFNLWRGNNPDASGAGRNEWNNDGPTGCTTLDEELVKKLRRDHPSPDTGWELYVDDYLKGEALGFIKKHPGHTLKLAGKKLVMFWTTDWTHPLARLPVFWVPYLLLSPFFLLGFVHAIVKWRRSSVFVLIPLVVATLLAMVFFVLPRYRMTIDPFFFIFVGLGALWLVKIMRRWTD